MRPATFGALVSATLYEKRFGPYFVSPVIAGLDPTTGDTPYLCGMDSIGAIETAKDFMVAGTAPDSLYGMCESMWRPDMVSGVLFFFFLFLFFSYQNTMQSLSFHPSPLTFHPPSLSLTRTTPFPFFPPLPAGRRRPLRDGLPVPALRHRPGCLGGLGRRRLRHHARGHDRADAQGAHGLRERRGEREGRVEEAGWACVKLWGRQSFLFFL
jgi:hypothetical protein